MMMRMRTRMMMNEDITGNGNGNGTSSTTSSTLSSVIKAGISIVMKKRRMPPRVQGDAFHLKSAYICHTLGRTASRGIFFGYDPLQFTLPALLFQLSLISIITHTVHLLLKPFGQPSIVSQILGGVVLGPSILGHNREILAEIFPPKSRVILENLSVFSLMLFIFLLGVKMDLALALRSGKKPIAIGFLGFIIPYGLASLVSFLLQHFASLDGNVSRVLPFVVEIHSMSAFPVVACFLSDLKILNSEIGRLASSSSVVSDVFQWSIISLKFAARIAKARSFSSSVGSFLSVALFVALALYGIRPVVLWAIRQTPEGEPVREVYIFGVFIALLGCGFIGEVIGISAVISAFILGLVIPDGPPLGAAIAERLDAFVSVLLMPIFFAICGLQTNVFSIQDMKNVGVIQLVVFVAFVGKLVGTMVPPLFYRMPFRDALSLALIMNAKGVVELALLNHKMKDNGMNEECFAIMIISVVFITGVLSPLLKILYDPSRRYLAYKRRTIRHSRRNEELRILACVHGPDNVRPVTQVLQVSNPTTESPINLTVLHLIRLMGRSSSLLVPHQPREKPSSYRTQSERIFNAFSKFVLQFPGFFTVNCFKGISPYTSMHNDVCSIALERRTSFIIMPFQRQSGEKDMVQPAFVYRHLNKNVLDKAPCSVGILVDHGAPQKTRGTQSLQTSEPSRYHVAVFFFGGHDDREALAYGMRMLESSHVMITLIRFCGSCLEEIVCDLENSKLLDGDILSEFQLNTMHKEERVLYEEMVLTNSMSLLAVIRSMETSYYDLIMVGRRHKNSQYMNELLQWGDCPGELGPVGEILALDFKIGASILVVQQQTRVWGLHDPEESIDIRRSIDL